ncbi:hypothetical protein Esti_003834 [Eimeria stiedai]
MAPLTLKVLNVAEKPSVAKEITRLLGGSNARRLQSSSNFNAVTSFPCVLQGQECEMIFTSVRGHLMSLDFPPPFSSWNAVPPEALFSAPVTKRVSEGSKDIAQNLKNYAKKCQWLVLWLDCDREGENIAFEVLQICQEANRDLQVFRAVFSAVTRHELERACLNLQRPNEALSLVSVCFCRGSFLAGAAFTRFLTKRYQNKLSLPKGLISYGPCQFPTLGFVVERFLEIQEFVAESFWSIRVTVEREDQENPGRRLLIDFQWGRERLFDRAAVVALFEICSENPEALITGIEGREVSRARPVPLSTVEMTKLCSRKLRIASHRCMQVAEALYNRGYISYPRTETERFTKSQDLKELIKQQEEDPNWGSFASGLLQGGFEWPRDGPHDDAAHPPIHPVKALRRQECENEEEWKLYEAITRHFLACCSSDAIGFETKVELDLAGETFSTTGLIVLQKNYLEIYPYDSWTSRKLPRFLLHERLVPKDVSLFSGHTQPPPLLSEADLIDKMDKHGIGTDATMHEHIRTIQERNYAIQTESQQFKPTDLGVALVKGYKVVGHLCKEDLSRPDLRASMERDMTKIAQGVERKENVVLRHVGTVAEVFRLLRLHISLLDQQLQRLFPPLSASASEGHVGQRDFCKCAKCGAPMNLMESGGEVGSELFDGDVDRFSPYLHLFSYQACTNQNTCNLVLRLPQRGALRVGNVVCEYCGFKAVNVENTQTRRSHFVCPHCFSHPPPREAANAPNGELRCFACCHPRSLCLIKKKPTDLRRLEQAHLGPKVSFLCAFARGLDLSSCSRPRACGQQ